MRKIFKCTVLNCNEIATSYEGEKYFCSKHGREYYVEGKRLCHTLIKKDHIKKNTNNKNQEASIQVEWNVKEPEEHMTKRA